eukprot:CAMPEP_0196771914 /NCGR_PEP_ID=MMETSP1104-20130614/1950_1 /TAXON_ID=33652 /ORGANISM="Cafeteria sp., Strain Caron Lab Isolate" /LENGTH=331 /DNA_ID=CAMNT_0042142045 /DNA_START=20 /DNA_END=1011 /DNA_ORIENTATION=+
MAAFNERDQAHGQFDMMSDQGLPHSAAMDGAPAMTMAYMPGTEAGPVHPSGLQHPMMMDSMHMMMPMMGTMPGMPGMPAHFPRMALPVPTEVAEEEPIYVNAKQYNRILKRREARARMEAKLPKQRKPFLHQSRHRHAMRRPRGPGGRFLSKEELEELRRQEEAEAAAAAAPPGAGVSEGRAASSGRGGSGRGGSAGSGSEDDDEPLSASALSRAVMAMPRLAPAGSRHMGGSGVGGPLTVNVSAAPAGRSESSSSASASASASASGSASGAGSRIVPVVVAPGRGVAAAAAAADGFPPAKRRRQDGGRGGSDDAPVVRVQPAVMGARAVA